MNIRSSLHILDDSFEARIADGQIKQQNLALEFVGIEADDGMFLLLFELLHDVVENRPLLKGLHLG